MRVTGILSVHNKFNKAVATSNTQSPPANIGIDTFEFWCPQRRPEGHNLALKLARGLNVFEAVNTTNGVSRPTVEPNAWVASPDDPAPTIRRSEEHTSELQSLLRHSYAVFCLKK